MGPSRMARFRRGRRARCRRVSHSRIAADCGARLGGDGRNLQRRRVGARFRGAGACRRSGARFGAPGGFVAVGHIEGLGSRTDQPGQSSAGFYHLRRSARRVAGRGAALTRRVRSHAARLAGSDVRPGARDGIAAARSRARLRRHRRGVCPRPRATLPWCCRRQRAAEPWRAVPHQDAGANHERAARGAARRRSGSRQHVADHCRDRDSAWHLVGADSFPGGSTSAHHGSAHRRTRRPGALRHHGGARWHDGHCLVQRVLRPGM